MGGAVAPLGVIHEDSLFRRGLCIGLRQAGFEAEECSDLVAWARPTGQRAAIIAADPHATLESVEEACTLNPELIVIIVTHGLDATLVTEALKSGASGVVNTRTTFDELVEILNTAIRGKTVMSTALFRDICRRTQPISGCSVSKREAGWMRDLAGGRTVRMLAEQAGYSEREMYRRLHRTYRNLGARNRAEALVRAASSGLLAESP